MQSTITSKSNKPIFDLITNRWALTCCSIITLQQMIEASATYWLVMLMASITQGENFVPYMVFFLFSVAFPYIPLCIASIIKISWKQESQRTFTNKFVSLNRDNVQEWGNKKTREQKLSILTSEGPNTIHVFIDYIWDLYSYVISVFLNILALSIVVEPLFALAYGFSLVCVVIAMSVKRTVQGQLTHRALTARIDLCESLLAAWDNVLLGNDYNFNIWNEKNSTRLERCMQRNIALERFDQFLAIFVTMMTIVPALGVVIYCVYLYRDDTVRLSAFVVTLPYLFMILSYTHQTLSLAFRWRMHRGKLATIYQSIQGSKESQFSLIQKVKWNKLNLSRSTSTPDSHMSVAQPQAISSHVDILNHTGSPGRITLRGENGSGKSTTLMLIKQALAKRAYFLPTHNNLHFNSEPDKNSTGEMLRNHLVEILEKVEADVLLLDEWDANLDSENQAKLSALIDQLSAKKCVIEVRHR